MDMQYELPFKQSFLDKLHAFYRQTRSYLGQLKDEFRENEPTAVYIKNPSVAAAWFLAMVDRYKRNSVLITPENFSLYFDHGQLELPLEARVAKST